MFIPLHSQRAEYWQLAFLAALSIVQSALVWGGLAGGMTVCVMAVASGELTVGDAVLFVTMMQQVGLGVHDGCFDVASAFALCFASLAIAPLPALSCLAGARCSMCVSLAHR